MERLTIRHCDVKYLFNELERLKEVNKALEQDNYNAEMNISHLTSDLVALTARAEKAEQEGRCVVLPCWGHVFIHSDGHVQEMEMCHYRENTSPQHQYRFAGIAKQQSA